MSESCRKAVLEPEPDQNFEIQISHLWRLVDAGDPELLLEDTGEVSLRFPVQTRPKVAVGLAPASKKHSPSTAPARNPSRAFQMLHPDQREIMLRRLRDH